MTACLHDIAVKSTVTSTFQLAQTHGMETRTLLLYRLAERYTCAYTILYMHNFSRFLPVLPPSGNTGKKRMSRKAMWQHW